MVSQSGTDILLCVNKMFFSPENSKELSNALDLLANKLDRPKAITTLENKFKITCNRLDVIFRREL